jgi:hypothetical protein
MRLAAHEVTIAAPVEDEGWEDGRMGVPPERTTVEIDLVDQGGATLPRLVHHGLPPEAVDDHTRGWAYFLGVLRDRPRAG